MLPTMSPKICYITCFYMLYNIRICLVMSLKMSNFEGEKIRNSLLTPKNTTL